MTRSDDCATLGRRATGDAARAASRGASSPQKDFWLVPDADGLASARSFVADTANGRGLDGAECQALVLAANEVLINAIEHGSPCSNGKLLLQVAIEGDELAFYVVDCGEFKESEEDPDPDELSDRGRGLILLDALTDDFELRHSTQGTVVRFTKRLDAQLGG